MTLELILRSYAHDVRTDRVSQDLRAYVRSEWQGDASWLRRDSPRAPLRARVRRWLVSRRPAAPPASPAVEVPQYAQSAVPVASVKAVEDCRHPDAEALGLSGSVVFLRCLLCGDVLVVDRGQGWALSPDAPATREEPLRV